MKVASSSHLTYCTNIHPGESWTEVLASLDKTLVVRQKLVAEELLSADEAFGIGLRFSARAAGELGGGDELRRFQNWLAQHNCYIFTLNGFPYGDFHGQVVKDRVHAPDWTTSERVEYTKLLFDQLATLLPEDMEGGISTSPLSYRFWFTGPDALHGAKEQCAANLLAIVAHLVLLREKSGKLLHLDIEPEPDGILETSEEFCTFFTDYVLGAGPQVLAPLFGENKTAIEAAIRDHLRLCYDVCHFAVGHEKPASVLERLDQHGIQVGKLQISAALRAPLATPAQRTEVARALRPYDESTYLHQTVFRDRDGSLHRYPDLPPAFPPIMDESMEELRTHFHVPIFSDDYGALQSTQGDIVETLRLWREKPFCQHLEVETYTWDVLPERHHLSLTDSIVRELTWTLRQLNENF